MKAAARRASKALVSVLTSKEARPSEVALAKVIIAGLGVKLGVNFAEWVK